MNLLLDTCRKESIQMDTIAVTISLPKSLLVAAGVREQELDAFIRDSIAIEVYRRRGVSLGKAAEIAGVATKWEMMSVLAKHDLWIDYTADDAMKDAETLRTLLQR